MAPNNPEKGSGSKPSKGKTPMTEEEVDKEECLKIKYVMMRFKLAVCEMDLEQLEKAKYYISKQEARLSKNKKKEEARNMREEEEVGLQNNNQDDDMDMLWNEFYHANSLYEAENEETKKRSIEKVKDEEYPEEFLLLLEKKERKEAVFERRRWFKARRASIYAGRYKDYANPLEAVNEISIEDEYQASYHEQHMKMMSYST